MFSMLWNFRALLSYNHIILSLIIHEFDLAVISMMYPLHRENVESGDSTRTLVDPIFIGILTVWKSKIKLQTLSEVLPAVTLAFDPLTSKSIGVIYYLRLVHM